MTSNMYPPYVVKFPPHTNTGGGGVLPFLYPGYSRLMSSGFAPSHLPITGMCGYKAPDVSRIPK